MLPTPDTSHISRDSVYEPAEDSFLLIDTLEAESDFLRQRFPLTCSPPPIIVETCVGSGIVLAFCTANAKTIFGRSDVLTYGIDVNRLAAKAAIITAGKAVSAATARAEDAGFFSDALLGDLAGPLRDGTVDVLLCNPPYVPSEDVPHIPEESLDPRSVAFRLQALATDGGEAGMEVTNRLLDDLPRLLSPCGVVYILLCAQNKPDEVKTRVEAWVGGRWRAETVGQRSDGYEKLQIVRIWRDTV